MKRFLCILFTMILLGSLLVIPISAAEDEYYIPAGEYRFNDTLTDFSSFIVDSTNIYEFDFESQGLVFTGLNFRRSSSRGEVLMYMQIDGSSYYIYSNNTGYLDESYRTITITEGFIAHTPEFYFWFITNTVRLDQPPSDVGSSVISVFSAIADWFLSAFGNIVPMFYDSSGLTLLGYIFILPLAFCVVYLFINFLVSSLLCRR